MKSEFGYFESAKLRGLRRFVIYVSHVHACVRRLAGPIIVWVACVARGIIKFWCRSIGFLLWVGVGSKFGAGLKLYVKHNQNSCAIEEIDSTKITGMKTWWHDLNQELRVSRLFDFSMQITFRALAWKIAELIFYVQEHTF